MEGKGDGHFRCGTPRISHARMQCVRPCYYNGGGSAIFLGMDWRVAWLAGMYKLFTCPCMCPDACVSLLLSFFLLDHWVGLYPGISSESAARAYGTHAPPQRKRRAEKGEEGSEGRTELRWQGGVPGRWEDNRGRWEINGGRWEMIGEDGWEAARSGGLSEREISNVVPLLFHIDSSINGRSNVVNLPFMGWQFNFKGATFFVPTVLNTQWAGWRVGRSWLAPFVCQI